MTREDDKRVAEIMGWFMEIAMSEDGMSDYQLPRFTSDPAADYTVLEYMRREYRDSEDASKVEVWELHYDEVPGEICDYEPGIFSMTALELDKKGVLK